MRDLSMGSSDTSAVIVGKPEEALTEQVAGGRRDGSASLPFTTGPGNAEPVAFEPLFRREAFEQAGADGFGRPVAHLPIGWRVLSLVLVAMVGTFFWLIASNSFERRETAVGLLRSASGEGQLLAPERGTIREVRVKEGDMVRAGQILVVVSTDRAEQTGAIPQVEMLRSLEIQERSLRQRLEAIRSTDGLETHVYSAQEEMLRAAQVTARADLIATRGQLAIVEGEHRRALPLVARGFVSEADLRRREQTVIQARQAVANALGQIARLEAQVAEQHSVAAKRPFASLREQGEISDTLADLEQRRAQYLMSRGYALRAARAGRVSAIQVSPGQIADPARPLMTIVPSGARMVATLYVPSRGVAFLRAGQRVRIRYDAFPFQAFGAAGATVHSVSRTILRPEDVEGAVRLTEPSYRVVAELDRQTMEGFGKSHALYPGMALSADIVLEERSLAAWLFEPLLAMKGRL